MENLHAVETRIWTDTARIGNMKEVLANYNKTRISIGHQHGWNWRKHWKLKLMLKCKHQSHCTCSSEIWTCIINDAWRPAPHRKQRKYTGFFWSNLAKRRFVRMFWRSILTFNARKKQTFKKNINKLTGDSAYKNIATLLRLKAEMLDKKSYKIIFWQFFPINLRYPRAMIRLSFS
jgi:hypothetical protein